MRTLHLTSPLLRGADVRVLQTGLAAKGWYRDELDGQYGPLTAQAVYRGKFWLGYEHVNHDAGDLFMSFLDGRRKQTDRMKDRTQARMHPPRPPLRQLALNHLNAMVGTKEHPAGSNKCWASEWYGKGPGPWCAMAVTWAYVQAGSNAFTRGSRYAFVPFIVADARMGRNHLAVTTNPQPGDLVAYDWDSDGVADHVGLFVRWASRKGGAFVSLEGNTAVGNDSNGGAVMLRNRVPSQVQAFLHCSG